MRILMICLCFIGSTLPLHAHMLDVDKTLHINIKECLKVPVLDPQYLIYSSGTQWGDVSDAYSCYRVEMQPNRYGVLSVQTGADIDGYRLRAVELFDVIRDGKVVGSRPGKTFTEERIVNEGGLKGRIMVFPPSPKPRYFFVITHKIGPGSSRTRMGFDHVWIPGVVLWAAGQTAIIEALTGGIVEGLGLEGWEAELGEVIIPLALGALQNGTDISSGDQILGIAASALPHLHDKIHHLGPILLFNIYRTMKKAFTIGLTRYGGDPTVR